MPNYRIDVISTDLPGENGHAGIEVVDENDNVIASIHGGPANGVGSFDHGFPNSIYRDDVALVTNMSGGLFSQGGQGHTSEHRSTLVEGLTHQEAMDLIEAGGSSAYQRFGASTEYQAAYHNAGLVGGMLGLGDLPFSDQISALANGVHPDLLYQNSNSVAYVAASAIYNTSIENGLGTNHNVDPFADIPVSLPGLLGGIYGPLQQIDHCFLGDTPIQMWPLNPSIQPHADGSFDEQKVFPQIWQKPISEVQPGDIVVSYDERGRLAPKPVVRTMVNSVAHILDFWGTGTTPGHAYYCADGIFKGQHVPIMDILRTDGAIMGSDGKLIRAATNCEVGSLADKFIHVTALKRVEDGSWAFAEEGMLRFGTRLILADGRHISLMEMAAGEGWQISEDGYMVAMVRGDNGQLQEQKFSFPYEHGETLPKPEAYILARSAVTLEEIYAAGEWEQIGTRMPAPAGLFDLTKGGSGKVEQTFSKRPNVPPAFADRPDAPTQQLADGIRH